MSTFDKSKLTFSEYRDGLLALLNMMDLETLNNFEIILDDKISGVDKFEAFLKIISTNNVKCLYACKENLQIIIEKHILFNS